jgi:hypothetical protein
MDLRVLDSHPCCRRSRHTWFALAVVLIALTTALSPSADARSSAKPHAATLNELHGLGRTEVESALRLETKRPIVVTSGKFASPRVTLTNRTTTRVQMGAGAAYHFESIITDETGGIVGGSTVSGSIGVGHDYHPIAAKATLTSSAYVAALGFNGLNGAAPPLAPGKYLLWVELPYSTEGVMRVAGPLPVTVK